MSESLADLVRLADEGFAPAVRAQKRTGQKIVGFFCSHVPEEILHAAGVLPVRLRAPQCASTAAADVYMSHLNCTYVRSCLEYLCTGQFSFLDGIICTDGCDHARRLYDVLRETRDDLFLHLVCVPHKIGDEKTVQWHRREFAKLQASLEESFSTQVTPDRLGRSIDLYNETRTLLRALYALRQGDAPPLSGAQTLRVLLAGQVIPRQEFNPRLRRLLAELGGAEGISGYRARLVLAGSGGLDNPAFLEFIEDLGGLVVADTLCGGSRYFWEPVGAEPDLLLALARAYLRRPSCANMTDGIRDRATFLKQMVRAFHAQGVVFQRMRYCDLWGGQLLHLRPALKEANIPLLSLEREYRLDNVGQLRTRVQAFLESMET